MEHMESRMQYRMECAEAEYNDLCERLSPPSDWQNPKWEVEDKVHNWRNYATEDVQRSWLEMSGRHRLIIAACLDDIAGMEEWD